MRCTSGPAYEKKTSGSISSTTPGKKNLPRRCEHGARHEETCLEIINGLNKEKPNAKNRHMHCSGKLGASSASGYGAPRSLRYSGNSRRRASPPSQGRPVEESGQVTKLRTQIRQLRAQLRSVIRAPRGTSNGSSRR